MVSLHKRFGKSGKDVHARESFRHHSYFSDIAAGVIVGLGPQGYELALSHAIRRLQP